MGGREKERILDRSLHGGLICNYFVGVGLLGGGPIRVGMLFKSFSYLGDLLEASGGLEIGRNES